MCAVVACKNRLGGSQAPQLSQRSAMTHGVLLKAHQSGTSHKHMHRNAASIRCVTMGGCRRMTHGGAQWWWPAKIIRVDPMNFCCERQSEWYTHEYKHPKFCFWEWSVAMGGTTQLVVHSIKRSHPDQWGCAVVVACKNHLGGSYERPSEWYITSTQAPQLGQHSALNDGGLPADDPWGGGLQKSFSKSKKNSYGWFL
jgi:hypothetical protein